MQVGTKVRSTEDGQIGFIAEGEGGGLWVRLDRRGTQLVPFRPNKWIEDTEKPRLTDMQISRVCYDCDRAIRLIFGEYGIREWTSLRENERLALLKGPPNDGQGRPPDQRRLQMWAAVRELLTS